jgi:membrane protein YdbS with pleckstrin-like domain
MATPERRSFVGSLVVVSRAHPWVLVIVVWYVLAIGIEIWLSASRPSYQWWASSLVAVVAQLPLIVGGRVWNYLARRRAHKVAEHAPQQIDDSSV